MEYEYKNVRPIKPRLCTIWLIEFEDKEKRILAVSPELTAEHIINFIKTHNNKRKFTVESVDVGEFKIQETINSYSSDSRKVTQDMEVTI